MEGSISKHIVFSFGLLLTLFILPANVRAQQQDAQVADSSAICVSQPTKPDGLLAPVGILEKILSDNKDDGAIAAGPMVQGVSDQAPSLESDALKNEADASPLPENAAQVPVQQSVEKEKVAVPVKPAKNTPSETAIKKVATAPKVSAPMPYMYKVVDGKLVCSAKHDKPKKSSKHKSGHMDMECCLDPDEVPNPNCYYPYAKYGKMLDKFNK